MANIRTRFPEEVLKMAAADGYKLDKALAAAVLTDVVQKFDSDQARDESGKWTSGGGGGTSRFVPSAVPQGRGGGGTRSQQDVAAFNHRRFLETTGSEAHTTAKVMESASGWKPMYGDYFARFSRSTGTDREQVVVMHDGTWLHKVGRAQSSDPLSFTAWKPPIAEGKDALSLKQHLSRFPRGGLLRRS